MELEVNPSEMDINPEGFEEQQKKILALTSEKDSLQDQQLDCQRSHHKLQETQADTRDNYTVLDQEYKCLNTEMETLKAKNVERESKSRIHDNNNEMLLEKIHGLEEEIVRQNQTIEKDRTVTREGEDQSQEIAGKSGGSNSGFDKNFKLAYEMMKANTSLMVEREKSKALLQGKNMVNNIFGENNSDFKTSNLTLINKIRSQEELVKEKDSVLEEFQSIETRYSELQSQYETTLSQYRTVFSSIMNS